MNTADMGTNIPATTRQLRLEQDLRQVRCSDDEHAHDVENLPCPRCGAAL